MSMLKRNILANFVGNAWTGLMSLIFVPLYIHFIGIEAYGLIGIFTTLLGLFALFDMGLSSTLNREIARMAVQEDKAQDMRDLVRTLEIPYWLFGLAIAVTVVLSAPWIAYHWVRVKSLSSDSVRTAITLMGLCVAFQWPISFYSGGLMGLQRQVLLNGINVVVAAFRGLGAVLILWLVSPTAQAFFLWQIAVSALNIGLIFFFLWRNLPPAAEAPHFRRKQLLSIWRFAAGMTAIGIMTTLLTQLDKVILSRMLSLEMFGYYSLANVVAMTLYRFIGPVFSATYPQLTRLVQLDAREEITKLYHKSAQLVSAIILPVALVVALFSREILLLWTRSPVTTANTHIIVSILIIGTAMHCLMHIPYALQLAYGWTRLAFILNAVSVLLLVPLMILLSKLYGAIGAACVWLILNTGYTFVGLPIMHRRLLPAEKWRWYLQDVGRPLLAAAVVCTIGRFAIKSDWPPLMLLVSVSLVSGGTLLASACAGSQLNAIARIKSLLPMLQLRKRIHTV
jgi:O-antigen/teichoic acid export membrane protein